MEHVKKIIVSIQFNENEIELGELVREGRDIYFKYYTAFIRKGIEISPFKLKLNTGINKADALPFDSVWIDCVLPKWLDVQWINKPCLAALNWSFCQD
jgi:serine/threonine-protein kinase HipA